MTPHMWGLRKSWYKLAHSQTRNRLPGWENEVKELESSSSVFLSQDCFDDSGSFVSSYKLKNFFCYSPVKTVVGGLIGTALNLWIALGSVLSL